ncbi:MAG TPA: C40 family peptidase [Turneriella sp.]|nr:C40 family peptidase [Turneriella sp.]
MQRVKTCFWSKKFRFWGVFSCAVFFLLIEAIPKSAAFAHIGNAAAKIQAEESIRKNIVRGAERYLGVPYIFGGATPKGFDCSGLIHFLYARYGFSLPRSVIGMRPTLRLTRAPQKGDVIFFLNDNHNVGHVGIYIDENTFIHSPREGKAIRYEKLKHPYWQKRFVEYRTVL